MSRKMFTASTHTKKLVNVKKANHGCWYGELKERHEEKVNVGKALWIEGDDSEGIKSFIIYKEEFWDVNFM